VTGTGVGGGRVAAIVVNWHDWDHTRQAVASVLASEQVTVGPVLVVDNESREAVPALGPGVVVLAQRENLGYAGGNNVGVRWVLDSQAADYILILNNDAILAPDALAHLVAYAQDHPDVGIVGPVLLHPDGSHQTSGGRLTFWDIRRYREPPQSPRQVDFVAGACLLVPARVWQDVGLFDERFFHYGEDVDLCLRVRQAGYRIVVVPEARVRHVRRNSLAGRAPQLAYYVVRNAFLFAGKHSWRRVGVGPVVRHLVPVRSLLKGDWASAKAAWQGAWDGMRGRGGRRDL
jgi:GT2 family glycosyltransferase